MAVPARTPIDSILDKPETGVRVVVYGPVGDSAVAKEDTVQGRATGIYRIINRAVAPNAGTTASRIALFAGSRYRIAVHHSLGLVTRPFHGTRATDAVWSAAFRPDGQRLALSANWGSTYFHLFLLPVHGAKLGKPISLPRIESCELAWRSDGEELANVQRDATCSQFGTIVRVDVAHPDRRSVLTKLGAANPAWDPVTPGS